MFTFTKALVYNWSPVKIYQIVHQDELINWSLAFQNYWGSSYAIPCMITAPQSWSVICRTER